MAASAHLARKGLFIVGAKRTPFGAFGGKLKGFSATELAYLASKAALAQAKVDPKVRVRTFSCGCTSVVWCGLAWRRTRPRPWECLELKLDMWAAAALPRWWCCDARTGRGRALAYIEWPVL